MAANVPVGDSRSNNAELALEHHYSPTEIAELWGVSPATVRRLFQDQRGVIEFGSEETRFRRKRKTMRIPQSVVLRVHEQRQFGTPKILHKSDTKHGR
jgi:predicted transcriptional regulator